MKLDPELKLVIARMEAISDNLDEMLRMLRSGSATANDLLPVVRRHETLFREGRISIAETHGEERAAILDSIIARVVACRREVELRIQ